MTRAIRFGASVAAAVVCVSCSNGVVQGPRLATNQTLRVMISDQPSTLDPGQSQYPYESAVLRAISEPLVKPMSDLSGVVPAAAQSYDVSSDGLTYTFHLRPNAMYWDGTPVRAQDFVYAWQRLIDPRLTAPDETFFADAVLNGERVSLMDPQHDASTIDAALATLGLKATDDHTFQVTLAHPDPAFLWLAAMPSAAPLRKDVVSAASAKWADSAATLMTNGPFKVTDMVKNDHITVVPNPYYWGGRAALKSITFVIVNDGAQALAKYNSGNLDVMSVQPAQAAQVAGDSSLSRDLVKTPDLTVYWFAFRVTASLVGNVRLRQAVSEAIDRNAFVRDVFQGQGLPAESLLPKGMQGYDSNLPTQAFDVAQARASLAASGVSAAQLSTMKFTYDQSSDFGKATAKFVHDQLKANLGADIKLQGVDSNTLSAELGSGSFQAAGPMGWSADYPDPADWFDQFTTTSSLDVPFYQNQQYDDFVRVARTDISPARRVQEYQQALEMLDRDVPVVFLAQSESWYLVRPYVRGVVTSPVDEWPGALAPAGLSIAPH